MLLSFWDKVFSLVFDGVKSRSFPLLRFLIKVTFLFLPFSNEVLVNDSRHEQLLLQTYSNFCPYPLISGRVRLKSVKFFYCKVG